MSDQPYTTNPDLPRDYVLTEDAASNEAPGRVQPHSEFTLTNDAPDRAPLIGSYRATLEFQSLQGQAVHGKVTVEGSALVVEQVITAAADAFRADAER